MSIELIIVLIIFTILIMSIFFLRNSISEQNRNVNNSLKHTTDVLFQTLKNTTDIMQKQMEALTKQIQNTTGQVGSRLDNAARVIGEVQKNLGELTRATQEIKELGQSVSRLDEILRSPKIRGGVGEFLLEDLLRQVLPNDAYQMQYRFRNGYTVDAIIRTSGGLVPVDSKFPLENFRKFTVASTEQEKKSAYRNFIKDVRNRIDEIAHRYILPDEGTYDFALMYVPAENIYYEMIIKSDTLGDEKEPIYLYALNKKVVPVSPNSFYAHLVVISLGLKGMQIEKSAKKIVQYLSRLQGDLQQFSKEFDVLGTHLTNAKNKYEDSARKLGTLGDKLSSISLDLLPEESQKSLP
ncbi:MAG: DNA recombination protein RmuC [Calditrichaeota bacterium]|nr:MAG: DNA recombination protein RmuC [Calditrichota bacterium]